MGTWQAFRGAGAYGRGELLPVCGGRREAALKGGLLAPRMHIQLVEAWHRVAAARILHRQTRLSHSINNILRYTMTRGGDASRRYCKLFGWVLTTTNTLHDFVGRTYGWSRWASSLAGRSRCGGGTLVNRLASMVLIYPIALKCMRRMNTSVDPTASLLATRETQIS